MDPPKVVLARVDRERPGYEFPHSRGEVVEELVELVLVTADGDDVSS
ncbi:hypothetical protein ACQPZQ_15175 [Pseudonocardia sp. CA-142604]